MTDTVLVLSPDDSAIDAWCSQFGLNFGRTIYFIDELPDDNANKTELLRYVARLRASMSNKNFDAVEGWSNALAVSIKSAGFLIPLATTMHETTQRAKRIHPAGTKAQKDAGVIRHENLAAAVNEYRKQHENAERAEWRGCLSWLKRQPVHSANKKICGYAESTATLYIKKIFKA